MPFPRSVIFEACTFLGYSIQYHGELRDLLLRWELDELERAPGAIHERSRSLFRFLRDNPQVEYDGRLISDLIVEEAVRRVPRYRPGGGDNLAFALERAGYVIDGDGQLRRTMPEIIDLPAADDEVHTLLNRHNLRVPLGHVEQAIAAHTRGDWAAANSQSRSFLESLLDEIALSLDPTAPRGQNEGEARRRLLANLDPPFLYRDLNEWSDDGKDFIHGIYRRLHRRERIQGFLTKKTAHFAFTRCSLYLACCCGD